MYKLIHNNRCSKSRECKKTLDSKEINYKTIEYKKKKLTKNQLLEIINNLEDSIDSIIRKNEKEYIDSSFDVNNKIELIDFLHNFPNCIQRPIFFDGTKYIICRPPNKILSYILE
jgi:arsenate reductase (glutaredoxin)